MNPICSKHFHPICGQRNNLRMEFLESEGLQAFCEKHGKKKRTVRAPRKKHTAVISDHEDDYVEDD